MTRQSLVSPEARDRMRGIARPFALAMGRLGMTPNALTVLGLLGMCLAAALAGAQLWLAAGIVSLAFAAFDLLDGSLARATGRVTKFGGFLDSTLDRAGDGAMYVGIAAGALAGGQSGLALASAAAMVPAFLVPYTRARAEGLGIPCEVGVAPRAERVVIMGLGLIATGLGGGISIRPPGSIGASTLLAPSPGGGLTFTSIAGAPWLAATLGILFVLSTVTVLQRIWHVRAQTHRSEDQ